MRRDRKVSVKEDQFGVNTRIEVAEDDATASTANETVAAFLSQALNRFKLCDGAEAYDRKEGLIDEKMADGEGVWNAEIKAARERKKRPCLTIDRVNPFIAHVANEERQARPAIQIDPVGDGADPEEAEIRQGLIRHIELDSVAETVYDTSFENMLRRGWSWMRVIDDWESQTSFNRVLKIQGFVNDYCVYSDPSAIEPTGKDMRFAFIVVDIPRGRYKALHPKSKAASLTQMRGIGDDAVGWVTADYVRVAEYYYVDEEPATLVQLSDGSGVFEDELTSAHDLAIGDNGKPIKRQAWRRSVKWAKINAVEILEGNDDRTAGRDWKGQWIPLIKVKGREEVIDGQRRTCGMIRKNRDAIRMYSYWVTAFTEAIALAPKSPWIAVAGQIERYKEIWDSANQEAWPYLPYDAVDVKGQPAPAPQRQTFEPPVQAMSMAIRQADNDVKLGFNIFDASLGQRGPQESARAILARKNESESGNINWIDNMKRSIQHLGEILLDLIPSRYDTARVVRIVRPNNKQELIKINEMFTTEQGQEKRYDLVAGKYSCVVTVGASHASRRQEAVEAMSALANAAPQLLPRFADLWVKMMDTPLAAEIARRLILPEFQEDNGDIPPAVQQKLQSLMEQQQMLTEALNKATHIIETKQLETASREYIAGLQEQTKAALGAAKLGSAEGIVALQGELKRITTLLELSHDRLMQENAVSKQAAA